MNLQMSVAEMVAVVLTGMVVVFAAILILIFIIWAMGKAFTSLSENKKQKELAQAKATNSPPVVVKTTPKAEPIKTLAQTDDNEVIAVIASAVAMMSLADGKNYRVKSVKAIKSTTSGRPAWSMAGLRENTRPFRQH